MSLNRDTAGSPAFAHFCRCGAYRLGEAKKGDFMKRRMTMPLFLMLSGIPVMAQSRAPGAPVYDIMTQESKVDFYVKASVDLRGVFDKWDATLVCASADAASCVLDLKVQADSVNTGSGMKDGKLKSKDFFNAKDDPLITFKSTKVEPTGPLTVNMTGVFTIRGESKPESLTLTGHPEGQVGEITGQMAFDRRDYGMNKGIPFIKIADRVEVNVDLKAKRTSGPPLVLKQ